MNSLYSTIAVGDGEDRRVEGFAPAAKESSSGSHGKWQW